MVTTHQIPLPASVRSQLEQELEQASRRAQRGFGRRGRSAASDRVGQIDAALTAGVCEEVRVEHDSTTALLTHEHGLLVLIPAGVDRTLMLDISSVGDDPRWDLHRDDRLMLRDWRWIRVGESGPLEFVACGDRFSPDDLGELHGTGLEEYLTGGDDGWPGDDATLDIGVSELKAAHLA